MILNGMSKSEFERRIKESEPEYMPPGCTTEKERADYVRKHWIDVIKVPKND